MDAPLDLYRASREELITVDLRQREQIAALEQEVARLRAELTTQRAEMARLTERVGTLLAALEPPDDDAGAPRPTTMRGLKRGEHGRAAGPARDRKRRARLWATAHAADGAPDPCGRDLPALPVGPAWGHGAAHARGHRDRAGPSQRHRARLPRTPLPALWGRWLPGPELDGVVVGQGRLGVGLLSLIAVLGEELRLPMAGIQWYLGAVHGLHLSVGGLVGALHTVATRAAPVVAHLQAAIRASPVLHADETGWREDGTNGYLWTSATTTERLFVRGNRARGAGSGHRRGLSRRAGQRFLCRLHHL
jgi:hypothetical protein